MDLGQKMFGRIYWWTGGRWLKGNKLQLKAGIHLLLRETILLVSGIIFNFFIFISPSHQPINTYLLMM